MPQLFAFLLSFLVHTFFLFVIVKGVTRDWKLHRSESIYLLVTSLVLSAVRVFVLRFEMPNLSGHLFSDESFFMILFIYIPALFLYFHKAKSYSPTMATALMAFSAAILMSTDILVDVAFMVFLPDMRLHWEMIPCRNLPLLTLHFVLHAAAAVALMAFLLTALKKLCKAMPQNRRLKITFMYVNLSILTVMTLLKFQLYSRGEPFFKEDWSWYVFLTFTIVYVVLGGALFHTRQINKKHEQQRKEDERQSLMRYMDELEQQQNAMRKFKHDYQNILLSLYSFIEEGDMAGLRQYYSTMAQSMSDIITKDEFVLESLSKIKVQEIKSIFAVKLMVAQNIGITTAFEASEEIDHIPIDTIAVVRMLGIILDNAIEELAEMSTGKLSTACFKSEDALTFVVENTCRPDTPKLHTLKQPGFSTKGEKRGMGLNNLAELAALYPNVTLSTSVEAGTFTQMITIYTQQNGAPPAAYE